MSYEKQTWQTGDIVTSAKLNHMEDGIENAQLPAVTISDVGKVLAVEEKTVQDSVLVPEETFVFTDGIMAEINMQNKSLFVEGAECLLTVDSTTTTVTVQTVSEPESGLMVQDNEIGITILLEDSTNVAKLYVPNVGTYTVSLYVEGTEYVWSPVEPSGVSASPIYLISFEGSAVRDATISGNYEDAVALLDSGKPIGFLLEHILSVSTTQIGGEALNSASVFWAYDLTSKEITIYYEATSRGWVWSADGFEYFPS